MSRVLDPALWHRDHEQIEKAGAFASVREWRHDKWIKTLTGLKIRSRCMGIRS